MQLKFLGKHDTYPQEFRAYVNTKLVPAWRILKARGWMELSKWQSKDIENSSYASCTSTTGFYRFPISQIYVSKGQSILMGQDVPSGIRALADTGCRVDDRKQE